MAAKRGKRDRDVNYTNAEIRDLVEIVKKYAKIIENKKTDGSTWREKVMYNKQLFIKNAWQTQYYNLIPILSQHSNWVG